ncbi:MAG TPA: hypothetical protein PLG73_15090 [Candidatus Sumerlaeota bacterium]|nr:hypothetical protein [Candidatus Sumerlaeota bacterium]
MIPAGVLTFREFVMREPLPLATVQDGVFEFLRGRSDFVLSGAQAVNAYVDEPRMSQDIDILSARAAELAEEIRIDLANRFKIAVRVRTVANQMGFRLYQVRSMGNRHLVDVRRVATLPPSRIVDGIPVAIAEEVIARKVLACHRREGQPKADTDRRDLKMLLFKFPELKMADGAVRDRLADLGAEPEAVDLWHRLAAEEIVEPHEDDEFF